jgi:methionyl aminopeptidase
MFGAIPLRTPQELLLMRGAGRIVAAVLHAMKRQVKPGVTTADLDAAAEAVILEHGARPAFKGYTVPGRDPFPASICASVNEEVVHGIPGPRALRSGDIVSIDVGVEHQGFYGDAAVTLPVGAVSREAARLMQVCSDALGRALEQVKPGNALGAIGRAVQTYAETEGCSVVRDFVGHGIGTAMHQAPEVPNFRTERADQVMMEPGLAVAIEPMIAAGGYRVRVDRRNGWVVRTADGSLAAHFEHTVAVTARGHEVLTRP